MSATWKQSFLKRRCLVPATAFIEWQARPGESRKTKLRIRPTDQEVFCFAGLWQEFKGDDGQRLKCYSIVTTTPNKFMRPIHHRMPVILTPDDQAKWLDEANATGDGLLDVLKPYAGPLSAEPA